MKVAHCPTMPAVHLCLDTDESEDGSSVAEEWFTEEEGLGAPRPVRTPSSAAAQTPPFCRSEALRQIASMAERHARDDDGEDMECRWRRHARSAPDLLTRGAAAPPSCCSSCLRRAFPPELLKLLPCLPGGAKGASELRAPTFDSPESSCILFDWDDTLLPTTFLMTKVFPKLKARSDFISPRSPHWKLLSAHARVVAFALRMARSVARVAIVTNSMKPWVMASADRYLPGINLRALLTELQIPVYYAGKHVQNIHVKTTAEQHVVVLDHSVPSRIGVDIMPQHDHSLQIVGIDYDGLVGEWNAQHPSLCIRPGDRIVSVNGLKKRMAEQCRIPQVLRIVLERTIYDLDPYIEAKRLEMVSCLEKFYGKKAWQWNVISIGDSIQEEEALKHVLAAPPQSALGNLCKTVNLLDNPSVEQLSSELRILMVWLPRMVAYHKSFSVGMDSLHDLEKMLFE